MKSHRLNYRPLMLLLVLLPLLACLYTGCTSTATTSTLGPLVAELAQARIAAAVLKKNPSAASKLEAVAAALDALAESSAAGEISDAAIRAFVAHRAAAWGLTALEAQLVESGLLAARATYLDFTKLPTVRLQDPQVRPWLDAIRRGIRAGIAVHQP